MKRWAEKTAVVTGAASGIGEKITTSLLKKGVNVVAIDVRGVQLHEASTRWDALKPRGRFEIVECDLSNEEDLNRAFRIVELNWNGVDIMVNNAGVIDYGRVIESNREVFEKLLNINILATAECINRAVRSMCQRRVEGHIININSVLGHEIPTKSFLETYGYNGWNLYPACKHATVALTHTVRRELAAIRAPIRITSISPGLVATDIARDAPPVNAILEEMQTLRATDVADAVLYVLGTRKEVQISELTIRSTGEL